MIIRLVGDQLIVTLRVVRQDFTCQVSKFSRNYSTGPPQLADRQLA